MSIIAYMIDHGFAVYADRPIEAGFCRTIIFSLFLALLNDEQVDEWVKANVTRIILDRAKTLSGGVRAVIEGMSRASDSEFPVTQLVWRPYQPTPGGEICFRLMRPPLPARMIGPVEHPVEHAWRSYDDIQPQVDLSLASPVAQSAWRICHDILTSPESNQSQREEAADWVLERSFYLSEVQDQRVVEAIRAANAQNIAKGREEAAKETLQNHLSSIGSTVLESPSTPSTEPNELTFSPELTTPPGLEHDIPVPRKDASQHVTPGPTATLPPYPRHLVIPDYDRPPRGDFSQPSPAQAPPLVRQMELTWRTQSPTARCSTHSHADLCGRAWPFPAHLSMEKCSTIGKAGQRGGSTV